MNVPDIVKEWLIDHDYDGLYCDEFDPSNPCGCGLDDLIPEDHGFCFGGRYCVPAYKRENEDGETLFYREKMGKNWIKKTNRKSQKR
ncbi:MAG: hypothetical protein LBQ52_04500 [Helicobacteraceae bacterium]|jgi:hypothetical protein|nr:hypothetical protein [Helicobacteraceae bacterium]